MRFAFCLLLAGCAYTGTAQDFDPALLDQDPGWLIVRHVPVLRQKSDNDCGAAALGMVLKFWGVWAEIESPAEGGLKAGTLRDFARRHGLKAYLVHGELNDVRRELARGRPLLVGLRKPYITGALSHYEVVVGWHEGQKMVLTLDPARGWRINTWEGFGAEWEPAGRLTIVVWKGGEHDKGSSDSPGRSDAGSR